MRVYICLFFLTFLALSCSDDDDNCQDRKDAIIEKYDELIELAEDDEAQRAALIRNKNIELDNLDC